MINVRARGYLKRGTIKKKINAGFLVVPEGEARFQADLQHKLEVPTCTNEASTESQLEKLKTAILKTSEEVLGYTKKKYKDCFNESDPEMQELQCLFSFIGTLHSPAPLLT